MILFYKNSFLASVVSILGCIIVLLGVTTISDGDVAPGIGFIVLSLPFLIGGKIISNNKNFKKWWKQVEDAKLEPQIAQNVDTAFAVYNKNPQNRTLKKIEALNPAAAQEIRKALEAKKNK